MDTKLIVTALVSILASGFIAPFSKTIFDKIFSTYNPKPEKIKKFFSNLFHIGLGYLIPFASLASLYFVQKEVNKELVLCTGLTALTLSINLLLDVVKIVVFKWMSTILFMAQKNTAIQEETIKILEALAQENTSNTETILKLTELHEQHLNSTQKLNELVGKIITMSK